MLMQGPMKYALWGIHWLSRAAWTWRSSCQPAWASHSTFSDFYLLDIALVIEILHHPGPIPDTQCASCFKILKKLGSFGGLVSFFTYSNSLSEA